MELVDLLETALNIDLRVECLDLHSWLKKEGRFISGLQVKMTLIDNSLEIKFSVGGVVLYTINK